MTDSRVCCLGFLVLLDLGATAWAPQEHFPNSSHVQTPTAVWMPSLLGLMLCGPNMLVGVTQSWGHVKFSVSWAIASSGSQTLSGHVVRLGEQVAYFCVGIVRLLGRHWQLERNVKYQIVSMMEYQANMCLGIPSSICAPAVRLLAIGFVTGFRAREPLVGNILLFIRRKIQYSDCKAGATLGPENRQTIYLNKS